MSVELFGFMILSAGMLAGGVGVVVARNPIHSALSLVASFFFLAGLYLMLNASFVAVIQVLVYAGAIMVLFLFVIMLLNLSDAELGEQRWNFHKVVGGVASGALGIVIIWAIVSANGSYLQEGVVRYSGAIERLEVMSTHGGFTNASDRDAFYADLNKLKVLGREKIRVERGNDHVRLTACRNIAEYSVDVDGAGCERREMQIRAAAYASEQTQQFQEKLLELQSRVDGRAIPAAWSGSKAWRLSSLEPTREELAVLQVLEFAYASQLNSLVEDFARGKLEDGKSLMEMSPIGSAEHDYPSPGERFALAQLRADELAGVGGDWLGEFEERRAALEGRYNSSQGMLLERLRAGQRGEVASVLYEARAQARGLGIVEQERFNAILVSLMQKPGMRSFTAAKAVYDEDEYGSVKAVGHDLFTRYLLPFEVTSVLLMVGILGAVVIAKRRL